MKRTQWIVWAALSALLLLAAGLTQAGVINPDPFERYAVTSDWRPDLVADGWLFSSFGSGLWEITADGYGGTHGLRGAGADAWPVIMEWHLVPDVATVPVWALRFQAKIPTQDPGWGNSWQGATVLADCGYPRFWAWFAVSAAGMKMLHGTSPGSGEAETALAGSVERDTWYNCEIEFDYPNTRARARFGPADGAMNAWCDWKPFYRLGANGHIKVQAKYVDFDNFKIPGLLQSGTIIWVK